MTTFAELVYAHFDWWRALRDDHVPSATKAGYHDALTRFEARHGEIVSAYWCSHVESAVALTHKKRTLPWATPTSEFHRESDWATQNSPDIARELHRCDELAVRAKTVLTGVRRLICMQLVMASAAHLLSLVDARAAHTDTAKAEAALEQEREALSETEKYYREAANGQAQIVYFVGMATVAIALSVGAAIWLAIDWASPVAALVAGALGSSRQRHPAHQRRQVPARLRCRPSVRPVPRRAAAADRRRLRARDLVRIHRRSPAPAGRGGRVEQRPPARAARRQLPRRLQRALGAGHARRRGAAGRGEAQVVTGDSATTGLSRGDLLRLDYDHTLDQLRTLTDVRFKLLALVPTVSGTAIGLLGRPRSAAELLGVGLLGLCATLGILVYELRNTQLYDYATRRAKAVERELQLVSAFGGQAAGGLYSERPDGSIHLLGFELGHDRGLALVYGAALAGWSYLVSWGALRALDVSRPRAIGGIIGVAVGLVVVAALVRITVRTPEPAEAAPQLAARV